ncbi:MAG TPA: toprim domain-containing protein [Azonexus sp.]|nr:toprim domain-containing protein [Azonexus sp.]
MAFQDEFRRQIDRLKEIIDLHDLAQRLGLERPGGASGNYRSPGHADASPSLSIFPAKFGTGFKDHSDPDRRGDCVALWQYVLGGDAVAAVKGLCEMYAIPYEIGREQAAGPRPEKSKAEYIAERCLAQPLKALDYLVQERGISERVARHAIERKAVGWNDWRSPKVEPGRLGHGGEAAAFVVRTLNHGHVVAVDLRYVDAALNGNVKTQCQGEKDGYGWTSDVRRLHAAKTVYMVESPINALSLECVIRADEAAYAIRGVGNVENIDWSWARGKQVVVVFDNDDPFPALKEDGKTHPQAGIRPGLKAAWALHERLTALDISALLVDQADWGVNDCNDFIRPGGPGMENLKRAVRRLEQWAIPGLPGNYEDMFGAISGERRLFLPFHHDQKYWRYRVRPDFTSFVCKIEKGDDDGMPKIDLKELAGFRVAGISRLTLQSDRVTLTGDPDTQPQVCYSAQVQTSRNGPLLIRKVFDDENLHNIERWKKFGPIWDQANFLRLVNILEMSAHIGARRAVNFIGLCWRDGQLVVNEGSDCYFDEPNYQCLYHRLIFPRGPVSNARRVIEAFSLTWKGNQALMLLIWSLSAHLKAFLRFWPHAKMQADKGAGKTTLVERLTGAIGGSSLSGSSLKTDYRLIRSVAYSSHPVFWDEFSRLPDKYRQVALDLLQDSYKFQETPRKHHILLLSGPVMVYGEDAEGMEDVAEKIVNLRLETSMRAEKMPLDMPQFPVFQWLQFLSECQPAVVRQVFAEKYEWLLKRASTQGAERIVENYAALLTGWTLLADFSGLPYSFCSIESSIMTEMNEYLTTTKGERHPWVWIVRTILSEIAVGAFEAPHVFDYHVTDLCLMVRTSDVMHHLKTRSALRDIWNALPVKSDRVFKRQLAQAGVIVGDVERTINYRRVAHLSALSLEKLETFGLHAVVPEAKG